MIIYENADKATEAEAQTRADPTIDPPPTYSLSRPIATTPSPELPLAAESTLTASKASNFICITRQHDSIKGNFTIDPTIYIPPSVLPPLGPKETEKDRKNLKLESRHGGIDVDLFVIGEKSRNEGRTTLELRSAHGRVNVKLNTPTTHRDPFCLTAQSTHNSLTVCLPRSYEGLLKTTANHGRSVTFSNQLTKHLTTFSEIDSTKTCFVGDLTEWKDGQADWKGDEVILSSKHGRIKVWYVDEVEPPNEKGFLSRVLGLAG